MGDVRGVGVAAVVLPPGERAVEQADVHVGQGDRKLLSTLEARTIKVEADHAETRRDIFGTPDPDGPRSFAQEMREIHHQTQTLIINYQTTTTAQLTRIDNNVVKNTHWIESRRKWEQAVSQTVGKSAKGLVGALKNKLLWALLLSGGGLGAILLWIAENVR